MVWWGRGRDQNPCQQLHSWGLTHRNMTQMFPAAPFLVTPTGNHPNTHPPKDGDTVLEACCGILLCCAQSCPTLCNPVDFSLPGSSVHGIFQARVLAWVAISYSRGSSRPRDQTCISCVSCIGRRILYHCITREDLEYYTVTKKSLPSTYHHICWISSPSIYEILPQAKLFCVWKLISVTTNLKLMDQNHTITSINAEKAFDKIQHPFTVETFNRLWIEGDFLNRIKTMFENPTSHTTFTADKLKPFF